MTPRRLLLLAIVLGISACGRSDAPDAVSIAEWTVVEDLRIGSVDDERQMLTQVQALAVDEAGRVYIAQPQDGLVRVFDAQGEPVRTIGGRGQGPGEFERLVDMGLLADTLWTTDLTSRRVTFFTLDGDVLSMMTIRPQVDPPFSAVGASMMFADGTAMAPIGVPVGVPGLDVSRVPMVRVNRQSDIVDTLATTSYERRFTMIDGSNGNPVTINQMFDDEPLIAVSLDGRRVAVVEGRAATSPGAASIRVTVVDPISDDTVFSRSHEYLPVRMDQAVADSTIARSVRARLQFFTNEAAAAEAVRGAMRIPEYFLPVARVEYSGSGELWVKREDLPDADQTWWVIGDSGDLVARVTLPMGFDPRLFRASELWGVMPDELDVPYVVRYRIVR